LFLRGLGNSQKDVLISGSISRSLVLLPIPKLLYFRMWLRKIPLDRILTETDAPFLTPVPYRGKPNEPSYVFYTAQKIAEIKGMDLETLGEQTTKNAVNVFNISLELEG